jgi:hypothetical protein
MKPNLCRFSSESTYYLEQWWQLFPRFLSQGRAKGEVDPDHLIDSESGADFTPKSLRGGGNIREHGWERQTGRDRTQTR